MRKKSYLGGHSLITTKIQPSKKLQAQLQRPPQKVLIKELLNRVIDAELNNEIITSLSKRHEKRLREDIDKQGGIHSWAKEQLEYPYMKSKKEARKLKKTSQTQYNSSASELPWANN